MIHFQKMIQKWNFWKKWFLYCLLCRPLHWLTFLLHMQLLDVNIDNLDEKRCCTVAQALFKVRFIKLIPLLLSLLKYLCTVLCRLNYSIVSSITYEKMLIQKIKELTLCCSHSIWSFQLYMDNFHSIWTSLALYMDKGKFWRYFDEQGFQFYKCGNLTLSGCDQVNLLCCQNPLKKNLKNEKIKVLQNCLKWRENEFWTV